MKNINDILRTENRSSPRGAPMGCADTAPGPDTGPLTLQPLQMVDSCYSADGTYWGAGDNNIGFMWCAWHDDGTRVFVRAKGRQHAQKLVIRDYPGVTFATGFDLSIMAPAFLECMIWAESGDPDSPLGANPNPDRLTRKSRKYARELCEDFIAYCEATGIDCSGLDESQTGHDLWLTMQGHGAGFWDRGIGALGDQLTKAAKTFSADCWIGRSGWINLD
jgi:hypothetical protein